MAKCSVYAVDSDQLLAVVQASVADSPPGILATALLPRPHRGQHY